MPLSLTEFLLEEKIKSLSPGAATVAAITPTGGTLAVTGSQTISGTLSVSGSSLTIDTNGHVLSSGSAPSAAAGASAATSPPAPVVVAGSTDYRGTITFGTGTSSGTSSLVDVTFAHAYASTPAVIVSCGNLSTISNTTGIGAINVSNTGFSIAPVTNIIGSHSNSTFSFSYLVIG